MVTTDKFRSWSQVNVKICGVLACDSKHAAPTRPQTAMQLAVTCLPSPPTFCTVCILWGEFCIPFVAQEPVPTEWTSLPAWKYPRDPKSHTLTFFSCSIKKRGEKKLYSHFLSACFSNTLYILCVLNTTNSLSYVEVCSFSIMYVLSLCKNAEPERIF